MLVVTAVLVAACASVGQGVLAVCGVKRWRWWAPAVGYAVLLIVFGQLVRLPHHQRALLALGILLCVAPLVLPSVRRALWSAAVDLAGLGVLAILLAAIPFFTVGHTGILGASVSDDMAQHLLAAFYLRTHDSMLPAAAIGGDLVTTGYPLGPHGIVASLTRLFGIGEVRAFSALTLAIPALTAYAVLELVPQARRLARWGLGLAIGLGYLNAAYLIQGSFKETGQALLVLAAALALAELVRSERPTLRSGIPLGLFVGGSIYNYSYGGAVWIVGAVVLVVLGASLTGPRRHLPAIRRHAPTALGGLVLALVTIAPEYERIKQFKKSIFGQEPLKNHGNLGHALNPLETLGVWFSGDFRWNPSPEWISFAASGIALAALIGALVWWWRRRELALVAALVAAIAVWIELALTRNIYNAAKGLVVIAPIAMTLIGVPLAASWSARRRGVWLPRMLGLALLAGALVASVGILRSGPVGLGPHAAELESMRPLLHRRKVLYLNNDHFAEWELRGAYLYVTGPLYAPAHLGMHPQKWGGTPVDVDNFGSRDLDKVNYLLVPGGAYQSEIPPNFRLKMRTRSYLLYHRVGKTPERVPMEQPGDSGTFLDCSSKRAKAYLPRYSRAGVVAPPIIRDDWKGSMAAPGRTATLRVRLPRGHWDISLQYLSLTALRLDAPGLHETLPASFGVVTAYWPAGTITSHGRTITLKLTATQRTRFGRLLGGPRASRSPSTPTGQPLWHAAFTRHGEQPRRVKALDACGRYVDWVAPAGGKMRGRTDGAP